MTYLEDVEGLLVGAEHQSRALPKLALAFFPPRGGERVHRASHARQMDWGREATARPRVHMVWIFVDARAFELHKDIPVGSCPDYLPPKAPTPCLFFPGTCWQTRRLW